VTAAFDLVRQYGELRDAMGGQSGPSPYQAPQAPHIEPAAIPEAPAPAAWDGGAAAPAPKAGKLASWGKYQFDSGVIPNIQKLTSQFPGLRVTSGYRDPAHNAKVGGVANSWHTKGRAVDLAGSARDMAAGAAWARQNGAREVLVHNAGSGQHLHVAW
jgi:hypothetical protein